MELNQKLKTEIMEIVAASFETGYFDFDRFEVSALLVSVHPNATKKELEDLFEDAYTYYIELVSMGPVGFYEEFKDEYDFDTDFIAEYGETDSEEE